jgi:hypothetical protein
MNRVWRVCTVLVLAIASMNMAKAAQTNETDSIIVAIDAAIQSLKQQPNQNMRLICTGVQATANGGGTGLSVTANGGGFGSQTTGMIVSMDNAQCSVAADTARDAFSQQAIQQLSDIKAMLQATTVDKPSIMSKLSELGKTYVAPALQAVIGALITKKLGL